MKAGVAELADAQASGACGRKAVWVQVPSPAYNFITFQERPSLFGKPSNDGRFVYSRFFRLCLSVYINNVTIQRTASALNCNAHAVLRSASVGAKQTATGCLAPCRIGFADAKYALWHILNAVYVRIAHMASIGVPASQVYWAAAPRQARGSALNSNRIAF